MASSLGSNDSWSVPDPSNIVFNNCTAISAFYATSLTAKTKADLNYTALFEFLDSLIPRNWTHKPSEGELLVWWENDRYWDEKSLNTGVETRMDECGWHSVCPFIHLEGDPDLVGIGMMASYYLVATLTTLYIIIINLDHKHWKRLHNLFEETLNAFLDASLLFSISMLLAAIYRFASDLKHPDHTENTFFYSVLNSLTLSIFSIFPPLILHLMARGLRRKGTRAILWFLIIVSVTALTVLYYKWRGPHSLSKYFDNEGHTFKLLKNDHYDQALWLSYCDLNSRRLVWALDRAIMLAQALIGLHLPGWIYLLFTIRSLQKDVPDTLHPKAWKEYARRAWTLDITVCCATMWLLLGISTIISARVADGMGAESKDRRLSVGQVLALATFAPFIIDIVAFAIDKDPARALEGKLTRSFNVVAREAPPTKATNANQSEYEMLTDGARMQNGEFRLPIGR